MHDLIDDTLAALEARRIGRREAVARLAAIVAGLAGGAALAKDAAPAAGTFQAVGLNHIALRVTDLSRSRDFYERHLGLRVTHQDDASCFMSCGPDHFVALFKASEARLDHYCYTIEGYDAGRAVESLAAAGLTSRRQGNRVYFDDPDGLEVQVAGRRE